MVGAQNRMRARKCGIEFQGLFGRGIRLGSGVIGVNPKVGKHGIGIRQS